jgi:hypothetical protein
MMWLPVCPGDILIGTARWDLCGGWPETRRGQGPSLPRPQLSSAEEFFETEFTTRERLPDLDLSVFDVDDATPDIAKKPVTYRRAVGTP